MQGRVYQYSSDTITKSSNTIAVCSTSTKNKNKLHIIIFCVKHNRERTITLEFEMRTGGGAWGIWRDLFEHCFYQCH